MTINVLIADDQEMVRTGLRQMIDAAPGLSVIGAAEDGQEALEMARRLKPDVCTLDIRMPRLSGLEVTEKLAQDHDAPAIIIVTTYGLEEYLFQALQAGASGFVLKDASAAVLIESIRAAATGEALISPALTRKLIETYLQHPKNSQGMDAFTPRERDILLGVCSGFTNDQLARHHHISLSTTKGHIANLMRKTSTTSRVRLVIWAYRHTNINP